MESKTHWKKVVSDPNFLGEADFQEGEEKIGTVRDIRDGVEVKTNEGSSRKAVLYFQEPDLKPMILNVVRCKAITKVTGSPYFNDWPGAKLQLYIDHNVKAFGEIVSAVRVRPMAPKIRQAAKCNDCGGDIQGAAGKSAEYMERYTKKQFGVCLCFDCAMKRQAAKEAQHEADEQ